MTTTSIVTVDSVALTSAGMLNRDCAFPITMMHKKMPNDEVLRNMPVFIGHVEDGTNQPVLYDQALDIDVTGVSGACDVAVVSGSHSECGFTVPQMRKVKLKSPTLVVDELVPKFCRSRNMSTKELGVIFNPDGSIDEGNPYAIDFARYVYAMVGKAWIAHVSNKAMTGDYADTDGLGFDGLYTQLGSGWDNGSDACPAWMNTAITFNWDTLTGGAGTGNAAPTAETVAGQTISLWGNNVSVPVGMNLAELLDEVIFPAIEAHWIPTYMNEGSDPTAPDVTWEMHVQSGGARCIINTASCFQPCNLDGDFDQTLRERVKRLRNQYLLEFYPSGRQMPVMQSPKVTANELWVGPREIGGNPTYGLIFRDMDEMFTQLGLIEGYGQQRGELMMDEPLLADNEVYTQIPFESRVIQHDVTKPSIDCREYAIMGVVGVVASARHLWTNITNVACDHGIDNSLSELSYTTA